MLPPVHGTSEASKRNSFSVPEVFCQFHSLVVILVCVCPACFWFMHVHFSSGESASKVTQLHILAGQMRLFVEYLCVFMLTEEECEREHACLGCICFIFLSDRHTSEYLMLCGIMLTQRWLASLHMNL